jgi:flagellin
MSSILTNASALTALQALNMTQQNLATTQSQISTGLKVASAADNAAYWSIAQNLQSDTGVLGAVNSSLAQSQSVLGAATAAINTVITTIHSMQTALSEANNPNADLTQINTTLAALGAQLTDAVTGASFNGLNLLDGSQAGAPLSFVSGYNVSTAGVASFNSIGLTTQALTGAGTTTTTTVAPDITDATTIKQLTSLVDNTTTVTAVSYGNDMIDTTTDTTGDSFTVTSMNLAGVSTTTTYSAVDKNGNAETLAALNTSASATPFGGGALHVTVATTPPAGLLTGGAFDLTALTVNTTNVAAAETAAAAALTAVTSYASIIGSTANQMTAATTFNSALSDNYTTGISALVDADMNEASTRLQALQTQQQLGIQSLSIANQNSQLILKLFGG